MLTNGKYAKDPTTSTSSYTLVSFDPDAPSREDQSKGPWRHLVRGGFKPKSLDEISATGGGSLVERTDAELLSPWVGPSPGQGTGWVSFGPWSRTDAEAQITPVRIATASCYTSNLDPSRRSQTSLT